MLNLPERVTLCEVGPRDGFQFEEKLIPADLKVDVITALADAGLPVIQVTSFVHPKWVPQMADAEEVVRRLPEREGVRYTGLALNTRGVERAHGHAAQRPAARITPRPVGRAAARHRRRQ